MHKLDLHIHTYYSSDAITRIEDLIKVARKKGLSVIAVTDHMQINGALRALAINDESELIIIPGIELYTKAGHLIALNIREKPRIYSDIYGMIEEINRLGGLAVAAHPFDLISPFRSLHKYVKMLDAIEAANAKALNYNSHLNSAMKYISKNEHLGFTAGSDSHIPDTIGNAYLETDESIESIDDAIDAILKRKCSIGGMRSPLTARFKEVLKTLFK